MCRFQGPWFFLFFFTVLWYAQQPGQKIYRRGWEGLAWGVGRGGGCQLWWGEAHQALNTTFEGSGRMRSEGSGRIGVLDGDGGGKKGVPVGVRPSVKNHQPLWLSTFWSAVGSQSAFLGLEVDTTIDDFVHHHGHGYCLQSPSGWSPGSETSPEAFMWLG